VVLLPAVHRLVPMPEWMIHAPCTSPKLVQDAARHKVYGDCLQSPAAVVLQLFSTCRYAGLGLCILAWKGPVVAQDGSPQGSDVCGEVYNHS
jgi:hypothetical protein